MVQINIIEVGIKPLKWNETKESEREREIFTESGNVSYIFRFGVKPVTDVLARTFNNRFQKYIA